MNAWYADFPDVEGRFAARLTSEVDVDHEQAVDELHIHALLRRWHADVRYEVGGVGPDFRVYEEGACVAGVEVCSLFQRQDWSDEEGRHNRLADEINRRVPPLAGYFVDLEIERADTEPPPRRVADFVARKVAELPPPETFVLPESPRRSDLPEAVYERDGVRVRVRFIPMSPDAATKSDPDGRIVGTGAAIGGMVNTTERLRDRIIAKAGGRYDIADVPFIIAVGVHDAFCSEQEVLSALYGSEAVVVSTGGLTRHNDGIFGSDRERPEGRHRRVSSVVVVDNLLTWRAESVDVARYNNPFARHPAPADFARIPMRQHVIDDRRP